MVRCVDTRAAKVPSRSHGDLATGKAVPRDYINATIGFEALGRATGTPPVPASDQITPPGATFSAVC